MKRQYIKFLTLSLTAAVMAFGLSCHEEEENPTLSLYPTAPAAIEFEADGVSYTNDGATPMWSYFIVQTNLWSWDIPRDQLPNQQVWDAQSNKTWLTVTKHYTTLSLRAEPAGLTAPEPAELTITAGNAKPIIIRVTQKAAAP